MRIGPRNGRAVHRQQEAAGRAARPFVLRAMSGKTPGISLEIQVPSRIARAANALPVGGSGQ
jgi:hypothetical protein